MWAFNSMTTYIKKRIIEVLLFAFILLSGANYYLNLGIFPRYAGLMMMLGVLMILIYAFRFRRTPEERKEYENYRKNKINSKQ